MAIYIFSVFFSKKCEYNGNYQFILGFIDKFLLLSSVYYYAYCELTFGIKYDLLPASKVLKYFRK